MKVITKQDRTNKVTFDRVALIASRVSDTRRLWTLLLLFLLCVVFYYFGELVDFAGWQMLRWDFFYSVHDIHRLFFLAPIIYAGYFFGVRASLIITIITLNIFLPRAFLISPFPDPLLRTVLFAIIGGGIGYLTGKESERRKRLEALVRGGRQATLGIIERLEEGVLIIGPDYRIWFTNPSMVRDFGEGIGSDCSEYLHSFGALGEQICKVPASMNRAVDRWEYTLPDDRTYEVVTMPFLDSDGTVCQLAIFKNISRRKGA